MGRRRSQSRHARARSACGVLWRWVAMSKRGQGRITLNAGAQAAVPCRCWRSAGAMLVAGGVQAAPAAFSPAGSPPRARRRRRRRPAAGCPTAAWRGIPTAARQQTQSRQQLQQSLGNLNHGGGHRRAAGGAGPPRARLRVMPAAVDRLAARVADRHAGAHAWLDPCRGRLSSTENGRSTVTINQTADRAILNWQTFNVGRDTTVDSPAGRVGGAEPGQRPAGRPSQIQGQIKAPGTVLIVNRNGVVFDGASQVNVRNPGGRRWQDQRRAGERGLYGAQGSGTQLHRRAGQGRGQAGRARIDTHAPGSVTQGGGYVLLLLGGRCTTPARSARRAAGAQLPPATASSSGAAWAIQREHCRFDTRQRIAPRLAANQDSGLVRNTGLIAAEGRDAGRTPGAPGRRGAGHDFSRRARAAPSTC